MENKELRLECLKLAVSYGSIQNIKDPVKLAKTYLDWVVEKSVDKEKKSPTANANRKAV
jgi:hypothetical protein